MTTQLSLFDAPPAPFPPLPDDLTARGWIRRPEAPHRLYWPPERIGADMDDLEANIAIARRLRPAAQIAAERETREATAARKQPRRKRQETPAAPPLGPLSYRPLPPDLAMAGWHVRGGFLCWPAGNRHVGIVIGCSLTDPERAIDSARDYGYTASDEPYWRTDERGRMVSTKMQPGERLRTE